MNVQQVYELLNQITGELTGNENLVTNDLTNVVDIGSAIFSATSVDNYVKSLVNKVGKVIAVNRPYKPPYPNIKRESWEYGSVLQKLRCAIPEAEANPSWDLQSGQGANQFLFTPPTVTQQFWNSKTTYDISMSFTEMQVKESFHSRSELMAFIGMIENAIQTSKTIKEKGLAEQAISNFMGEKIYNNNGVVHLVTAYNNAYNPATPITMATAIYDPSFLRFASVQMMLYKERLKDASNVFNMGTVPTFTPEEFLHIVVNSEFAKSVEAYMTADTYHDSMVRLPNYDTVNFWQSIKDTVQGETSYYDFSTTSSIQITTSAGHSVTKGGIVAVMFDRDAIMLCNENDRVTTAYNAKQEYINNFYKFDISLFNDTAENGIVFVLD
jgi:hypothetical protein